MPLMTFLNHFLNQSTTESTESTTTHPSQLRSINQHNSDVHRGNLVFFEDDFGVGGIGSPRLIGHNSYRRYVQLSPLLPFGMMLIISTIIFILIIFRRWPGLVAGIVAGCLTSISIYLLLLTLKEQRLVYE
ncbi:hypothetical protein HA402_003769 [Bradysia odoriphaga]|nr:hypothetical protein HA402_003769 [Bradysia odoriphaga]